MDTHTPPRPVVVGYDLSDSATIAVDWAGELAESTGAPVKVLHAAETIVYAQDVSYGLRTPTEERELAEKVAREGLKRLRADHPDLAVEATGSLLSAKVALDEASTTASLIVVGSRGRGRFGSVMLGSTAYALSGHARCPVVVVRETQAPLPGPGRPLVVGSDGSLSSDRAVTTAAELATRWHAPLVVVTSWTPPPPDPWEHPPFGYASVAACLEARQEGARQINEDSVQRVRASREDLNVQGLVVEARPEDAIMNATPDAGMLVLGSRGHGTMASALLGSTARSVLHQSTKPVMVVH